MEIEPDVLPLPFLSKGISQVAIIVPDLEKTVGNYFRYFGIGPWHFYTYQLPLVKSMTFRGEPADHAFRIALAWLGETRIELIELLCGNTIHAEFVKKHGYGVHHFGLAVKDMASNLEAAKRAGLEMVMDGQGFGAEGDGHYAYLDTEDLLGVTLELIERPQKRIPPEKVYPPEG